MCFYSGRFDGIAQYMRAAPLYIEHFQDLWSVYLMRLRNAVFIVNQQEASIFCKYNITSTGGETIYKNKI
jgi:hypothetical protein